MAESKVVIIGLDGATLDLIEPWVQQGKLPNLARLIREGASGELRSTIPPVTAPAWISLMTGKNPGRHGVYNFRTFDLTRYESFDDDLITSRQFAHETIFRMASDAGRRVAALTVPMTYPPFPVNGVLLSGYPTPNLQKAYTYPPEMAERFANINITSEFFRHSDPERVRSATHMVKQLTEYCVDLMTEEPYDLFMVVYTNTDMANHFFRKYMDPTYPTYDSEGARVYGNVLLEQYQLADEAVGHLVEQAGDDANVLIVSDHGSGVHATHYFHTNSWLNHMGWLKIKGGVSPRAARAARAALEYIRVRTPWARDFVKRRFPDMVKRGITSGLQSTAAVDWSGTMAYRLPMFHFVEGIVINLAGRQPQGIVQPGREYEELRDQIMAGLGKVTDPATGRAVLKQVLKREEEYSGPFLDQAPDLIVFYDYDYAGGPNPSGSLITPIERYTLERWSGLHRMNGTLIMWGKDILSGVHLGGARIEDPAPTLLYLLGLPVPKDMDGRVLSEALSPSLLSSRPLEYRDPLDSSTDGEKGGYLDQDEEEQIREALRGFGYIE
ncbi:MAG: alkaline phosphatase family protein [Anaerolineae bacterium]|nr:alkaline phosphatase family protein [Anaerolineae bacterium]